MSTAADTTVADELPTATVADLEPAAHYLAGIVRLVVDRDYAAARAAIAQVAPDLFDKPSDRDLYRALSLALTVSDAPTVLEVRLVAEHDDQARSDFADVAAALVQAVNAGQWWHAPSTMHEAAEQLRARHAARQARELGLRLVEAADQELEHRYRPVADRWTPAEDDLERAIRLARTLRDHRALAGRPGARDLLAMVDRWRENVTEKLVQTGFAPIDQAFGGGLPVGLHGLAAAPGVGKSALAVQLALGAMLHDPTARVVWLRGEMTDDLLLCKMLAAWSRLRSELPAGPPPDGDLGEVGIRDALRRSPCVRPVLRDLAAVVQDRFVSVDPPITPDEIERRVEEHRPALVVVDYLQLVEGGTFKERRVELEHIVRRLANVSTRHDLPIVVVSAIAKGTNTGSDIGTLTKESNALDFQAHTYVSLWPEGRTREERIANPRRVLLKINKSRTAQHRDYDLWFDGRGQFYRWAAAEEYEEFGEFAPR